MASSRTRSFENPADAGDYVSPGWYFSPKGDVEEIYYIESFDKEDPEVVHALNVLPSGSLGVDREQFYLYDLYSADKEGRIPVLARTLDELLQQLESNGSKGTGIKASAGADIPKELLDRADEIISIVERVEAGIERRRQETLNRDKNAKFRRTPALLQALEEDLGNERICMVWYYEYRKRYKRGNGDRVQIAAALRRSTYKQSTLTEAQAHFVDKFILRYYGGISSVYSLNPKSGSRTLRGRPLMRPSKVFKLMKETLDRTGNLWIDPALCAGTVREDVVDELMSPRIAMSTVLGNVEKAQLLSRIKLPSRGWFYEYLTWFKNQPGKGKTVIISRYGKAAYEHEFLAFDTYVKNATMPLQFVVGDHHLIKCYIVDREGRSYAIRLWLTVLIDCYSRACLGFTLSFSSPNIESTQAALRHAIWPKDPSLEIDHEPGERLLPFGAYGIPRVLSLDNAFAHHSHSLENLARQISRGGRLPHIKLEHRPPYLARWGALIERLFRNFSGQIRELLVGSIQSREPGAMQEAAKAACLLYEDIYNIVYRMILNYQHTKHSEIGTSPYEKWTQGMQGRLPHVPPLDEGTERLFWREFPGTRPINQNGMSAFGLNYWSADIANPLKAPRIGRDGKKIKYSFRYREADITRLAVFSDGTWIGDVQAKRFREADGTTQAVSLWAWETAKRQYSEDKASGLVPDNLGLVDYVQRLTKTRRAEQIRAQAAFQDRMTGGKVEGNRKRNGVSVGAGGRSQAPVDLIAMEEAVRTVSDNTSYTNEDALLDFLG